MTRLLATLTLLAAACSPAPADPAPPPVPEAPPADALEASLRTYGADRAPYMDRVGEAMRGELRERQSRDLSALLRPGWCYKIVAIGGEGLGDLDVSLFDGNNVLVERDTTREPRVAIGVERPVCPPEAATYRIEVRATSGAGPFAVQVYQSI
ncbi:MAG: hypothetical protein IT378_13835 [Sandaracinaceae bacterium]|nr:hypothetical protein [Sandaracinaceae bacterium]